METKPQVHKFDVSLNWEIEVGKGNAMSGSRPSFEFGPPPEFGGKENTWSPEHLLAASLATCYTTTLMHFAKLLKISVLKFDISCQAEFTKKESGFEATNYYLTPVVVFENHLSQIQIDSLLTKAKKYCFISNSVKGEVIVNPDIRFS